MWLRCLHVTAVPQESSRISLDWEIVLIVKLRDSPPPEWAVALDALQENLATRLACLFVSTAFLVNILQQCLLNVLSVTLGSIQANLQARFVRCVQADTSPTRQLQLSVMAVVLDFIVPTAAVHNALIVTLGSIQANMQARLVRCVQADTSPTRQLQLSAMAVVLDFIDPTAAAQNALIVTLGSIQANQQARLVWCVQADTFPIKQLHLSVMLAVLGYMVSITVAFHVLLELSRRVGAAQHAHYVCQESSYQLRILHFVWIAMLDYSVYLLLPPTAQLAFQDDSV
jgi:hypothetical protein